jgi:hypothetical protein
MEHFPALREPPRRVPKTGSSTQGTQDRLLHAPEHIGVEKSHALSRKHYSPVRALALWWRPPVCECRPLTPVCLCCLRGCACWAFLSSTLQFSARGNAIVSQQKNATPEGLIYPLGAPSRRRTRHSSIPMPSPGLAFTHHALHSADWRRARRIVVGRHEELTP